MEYVYLINLIKLLLYCYIYHRKVHNKYMSIKHTITLLNTVRQRYPKFSDKRLLELREEFGQETFPEWLDTIYIGEHPNKPEELRRCDQDPEFWLISEYHCYRHYFNPTNRPGLWIVKYLLTYYSDKFSEIMSYFCALSEVLGYNDMDYSEGQGYSPDL
jgi:hypothetical protein